MNTRSPLLICASIGLCLVLSSLVLPAQQVSDLLSYSVIPSCESPDTNKPTQQNQYYFELTIKDLQEESEDLEILVDNNALVQFHIDKNELPFIRYVGPFDHSGVGGTYREYTLKSLSTGISDTLYLPEVVCGYFTSNGLNDAGYYCDQGAFGVIAQMSPEAIDLPKFPDKAYLYVLLEKGTNVTIDRNFSGLFNGLTDLSSYELHAFAIPFEEQASFINQVIIGEPFDQETFSACYATCGVFDVSIDCSSFDLSLTKTVRGGFVYEVGDTVTFDIEVTNDGLITAYDIEITDMLPLGLDFLPDINPHWQSSFISHPIDSLEPGNSIMIPIKVRVNASSIDEDIINRAEITFAAISPNNDAPAFDVDSTPDNEDLTEDDIDDAEITILENLCAASFEISAANEAVCLNGPLSMSAYLVNSTPPVRYLWRFNGQVVSRDSLYTIPNHQPSDYGTYSLTIIDGNGCSGTEFIAIEPVDDQERFSCIDDINVGVNSNCEIRLRPDMFTSRDVSGINDYDLEIRDEAGNLVEQSDLWSYRPGTILEVKVINPCTEEAICWSRLHIEHKLDPQINIYGSEERTMPCALASQEEATSIIANYNELFDDDIMDAQAYADSFNQLVCIQEWEVDVIDLLLSDENCEDRKVQRIYSIYDQERRIAIDTATVLLESLDLDSIAIPSDVSNLTCLDGLLPGDLNSYPSYTFEGSEFKLEDILKGNTGNALCNIAISYSDQEFSGNCRYGATKIVRTWSISDWCSNQTVTDIQHLYVVDNDPPEVKIEEEDIVITTAPFACFATIDLREYIDLSDQCGKDAFLMIEDNAIDEYMVILPIGDHKLALVAYDGCGNEKKFTLDIQVSDRELPVALINQEIVIAVTQDTGIWTNYITAEAIDAGSHDHDCGPVDITIARVSELSLISSGGGELGLEKDFLNCGDITSENDVDNNGSISRIEAYRHQIVFCCRDIGKTIRVSVRVTDIAGNETIVESNVTVQDKLEWTACDDNNPCTLDDRQYGDCGCSGTLDLTDVDGDGIMDCSDPSISLCLNGSTITATYAELAGYLSQGATGGACNQTMMARLSGKVYTMKDEMVQGVSITNEDREEKTNIQGAYRFEDNEMYSNYALIPNLDKEYANGVSVTDLVILEDYILGLRKLDDPYLKIAADINNDGRISALDLQELRLLLLGHADDFSNDSWRFVVADYVFIDEQKPHDFEEVIYVDDLQKDMANLDWIGVKIGDLNHTAIPNDAKSSSRSKNLAKVLLPAMQVNEGDYIEIPLTLSQDDIYGIQMSLKLDGLQIEGVEGLSPAYYHLDKAASSLRIVNHQEHRLLQDIALLQLSVNKSGSLSDMIELGYDITPEAVYEDLDNADVSLQFEEGLSLDIPSEKAQLYQNQPNPFTGETVIQFRIPEAGEVSITFFSSAGQLIYDISDKYGPGVNAVQLTRSDLSLLEGVVFYRMSYLDQVITRRMVLSD